MKRNQVPGIGVSSENVLLLAVFELKLQLAALHSVPVEAWGLLGNSLEKSSKKYASNVLPAYEKPSELVSVVCQWRYFPTVCWLLKHLVMLLLKSVTKA